MPPLDPLLAHALRLVQRAHRRPSIERPECARALTETVTDRLLAEDGAAGAELDVGVWGWAVYAAAARAAVRLQCTAIEGDELP